MTQEEKELLLKDLSGRVRYGVRLWLKCFEEYPKHFIDAVSILGSVIYDGSSEYKISLIDKSEHNIEGHKFNNYEQVIKPYLRPMSSMTEEEKEELLTLLVGKDAIDYFQIENSQITNTDKHIQFGPNWEYHWINFSNENIILYMDWLNKKHFDYRGLIPMGLALVAPKGMYNTK